MAGKSLRPRQLPGPLTGTGGCRVQYCVPSSFAHLPPTISDPCHTLLLFSFRLFSFSVYLCLPFSLILFFPHPHCHTSYHISGFQKTPQLSRYLGLSPLPRLSLAPCSTVLGRARHISSVEGGAPRCSRKALFQILPCFTAPTPKSGLV